MVKRRSVLLLSLLFLTGLSLAACGNNKATSSEKKTAEIAKSSSAKKKSTVNSSSAVEKSESSSKQSEAESQPESSSGTEASSSSNESSQAWSRLSPTEKYHIYAAWIQNSQGIYEVYTGYSKGILFINVGPNGTNEADGNQVSGSSLKREANSALFVESGDRVIIMAPAGESNGAGYTGDWKNLNWQAQESLTGQELIDRYSAQAKESASQIKFISAASPEP